MEARQLVGKSLHLPLFPFLVKDGIPNIFQPYVPILPNFSKLLDTIIGTHNGDLP